MVSIGFPWFPYSESVESCTNDVPSWTMQIYAMCVIGTLRHQARIGKKKKTVERPPPSVRPRRSWEHDEAQLWASLFRPALCERCERSFLRSLVLFCNGSVAIIGHAKEWLLVAGAYPVVLYHWSTLCTLAGIVQHLSENQPGSKLRCFKRTNWYGKETLCHSS